MRHAARSETFRRSAYRAIDLPWTLNGLE